MIKPKPKRQNNPQQGGQYAGMAVIDPGVTFAGLGGQFDPE
jgi:hypothetical protein